MRYSLPLRAGAAAPLDSRWATAEWARPSHWLAVTRGRGGEGYSFIADPRRPDSSRSRRGQPLGGRLGLAPPPRTPGPTAGGARPLFMPSARKVAADVTRRCEWLWLRLRLWLRLWRMARFIRAGPAAGVRT